MAWNPTPEVAAVRDFAAKFGADRVVVLYTTQNGQLGYASYGKTMPLCAETKRLGDALFASAMEFFAENE